MNDINARPVVRPRFLKTSLLVFVLLLPFLVHAACDYSASRKLARTLAEIRAAGEPTSVYQIQGSRGLTGSAADAARYYRAAAALAYTDSPEKTPQHAVDESLRFLDLAAALEFRGFPPGSNYNYRLSELFRVGRLAQLRTERLLEGGDTPRAALSLYAQLRLMQAIAISEDMWPLLRVPEAAANISRLASGSVPEDDARRLGSVMADLDRDDWIRRLLLSERASLLDRRLVDERTVGFWAGPLYLRFINGRLDILRGLLQGTSRPWPQRLDVPKGLDYSSVTPPSWFIRRVPMFPLGREPLMPREMDIQRFMSVGRNLAWIRCARVALAAMLFRQSAGALPSRIDDLTTRLLSPAPIDPFAGTSIQLVTVPGGGVRIFSTGKERDGKPIEIQIAQR